MFSEKERKVFSFIKNLPRRYFIWFWVGIGIYALKYVVNYLIPLQQKNFLDKALETKNLWIQDIFILIALFGVSVLLLIAEYVSFRTLRVRVGEYLYKLCVNRIIRLPKQTILSKGTGYYNSIIVNQTEGVSSIISPFIFDFFFSTIQMIFINIIVFQWNKWVFLVFCIAYVFAAINTWVYHHFRKKYLDNYNESLASISSETQDIISNSFTIRSFNVLAFFTKPLWKKVHEHRNNLNTFLKIHEMNRFVFAIINTTSLVLMIILVLQSIFEGNMTYGQLLALVTYFGSIFIPFHNYVTFLGNMIKYGSWLNKFDEAFKNLKKDYDNPEWVKDSIKSLSFNNVLIPYQKKALPLNFELKGKIGFVGLSGEGKTSILKVLYREIAPSRGTILLNNTIPYDSLPLLHYYERINILSQEVEIFNKDLNFNLLLGKNLIPSSEINNRKRILEKLVKDLEYLKISSLEKLPELLKPIVISYGLIDETGKIKKDLWKKFIEYKKNIQEQIVEELFWLNFVLKEDYEKVIKDLGLEKIEGRNFGEKGTFVSGGEKQRIAFGRFLLKKNFDFFVIDEPFASLDAINESKALSLIKEKIKNKEGFVITHKFHIIESLVNYFLVIDNGKIVEEGSGVELIKKEGVFYNLRKEFYKNVSLKQI